MPIFRGKAHPLKLANRPGRDWASFREKSPFQKPRLAPPAESVGSGRRNSLAFREVKGYLPARSGEPDTPATAAGLFFGRATVLPRRRVRCPSLGPRPR